MASSNKSIDWLRPEINIKPKTSVNQTAYLYENRICRINKLMLNSMQLQFYVFFNNYANIESAALASP